MIWIEVTTPTVVRCEGVVLHLRPDRLEALPGVQACRLLERVPAARRGDPEQPCGRCGQLRFLCLTCGRTKHGCWVCRCTHIFQANDSVTPARSVIPGQYITWQSALGRL